jgi:DNA-binding MarR family transcriptional regulator
MSRFAIVDESAPAARLGMVLEFMRTLWAVDHVLQTRSRRLAARQGVPGPQRLVLRVIGRNPGIPAGRLAVVLHLHPSTLTDILRRLQRRGFIRRTTDPKDRRRALFHLTRIGRRCNGARSGTVEAAVRNALSRLSARDIASARAVLTRLAHDLRR